MYVNNDSEANVHVCSNSNSNSPEESERRRSSGPRVDAAGVRQFRSRPFAALVQWQLKDSETLRETENWSVTYMGHKDLKRR